MRSLSDFLFALLVALISGGGWYLAHWGVNLLLAELRAALRYRLGGA